MHVTSGGGPASLTLLKHSHLRVLMIIITLKDMVLGLDEAKSQLSLCPQKKPWTSLGWRQNGDWKGYKEEAWITARRGEDSPPQVCCCS